MAGKDKKIIILTGPAGVGKDTLANSLISESNGDAKNAKFSYADSIKDIAFTMGWNGLKDDKGRSLLQQIGDIMNSINPDTIVDILIKKIERVAIKEKLIVITDARYDKEVTRVKEYFNEADIEVLKLERLFESKLTKDQQQHKTELGISEYLIDSVVKL
jgi:chromosomal replication initiation ATPase DnaA